MPLVKTTYKKNSTNVFKQGLLNVKSDMADLESQLFVCQMFIKLLTRISNVLQIDCENSRMTRRKLEKIHVSSNTGEDSGSDRTSRVVFDLGKLLESFRNKSALKVMNTFGEPGRNYQESKDNRIEQVDKSGGLDAKNPDLRQEKVKESGRGHLDKKRVFFRKKMQINLLLKELQNHDLLFLLNKIKKHEMQFEFVKSMRQVKKLKLEKLGIAYSIKEMILSGSQKPEARLSSQEKVNGKIDIRTSKNDANRKNKPEKSHSQAQKQPKKEDTEENPELLYKALFRHLIACEPHHRDLQVQIKLSKEQEHMLERFVSKGLQVFNQKTKMLKNKRVQFMKSNRKMYRIANEFWYDQSFDSRVSEHLRGVKFLQIKNTLEFFLESNRQSNTMIPDTRSQENRAQLARFNYRWPFSLEPLTDGQSRRIFSKIKYPYIVILASKSEDDWFQNNPKD